MGVWCASVCCVRVLLGCVGVLCVGLIELAQLVRARAITFIYRIILIHIQRYMFNKCISIRVECEMCCSS